MVRRAPRRGALGAVAGLLAVAAVAACGGPSQPAESAGASAPRGVAWDAMTPPQKEAYMRETVMPRMKALFLAFDPHRYAKLDCVPCHSQEREKAGWKMPNPDLLLAPACVAGGASSIYGSESAAAAMETMNAFMRERVQPEMAALLGRKSGDVTALDASAPGAFGCFGCHTMEAPAPMPVLPRD